MAWQTVATTGLGDGSSIFGYVYLQYDDASSGTSRNSRLRFELRSGYSIYVYIDNLRLDGSSVKGRFLCQGTMDFWTGSLANGARTFTWSCPWYSGTRTYTCSGYIPSGVTAPSGLSVSLISKTHDSATLKMSIASYGVPSGVNGRYIEAAILDQNSYGASYRLAKAQNTTSSTVVVDNSSIGSPSSFQIEGNHKYWYGGFATNTQVSKSVVSGIFYTPCPPLINLSLASQSYVNYDKVAVMIKYSRQSDSGTETRTGQYRYSTDNGATYSAWTSFGTINTQAGSINSFVAILPTSSNIRLQTKISTPNGGDSESKELSIITLKTHIAPNFSEFEYVDNNPATVALTNNNKAMVQGQSSPLVTISTQNKATGNDGVSVSNYTVTFTGQSKTVNYSDTGDVLIAMPEPSDSGTNNLTVSAIDSLSLARAVTKTVVVYPWERPTISTSIERKNNFESQSTLKANGKFAPISINGNAKNSLTFSYRTRKSSSSNWNEWIVIPVVIDDDNWSIDDFSVSLDNNSQWDIQSRISDNFENTTADLVLSVGVPNFFIGVDGRVSIGMRPNKTLPSGNRGQLEVDGLIYSKGQLLMPSHVGQIIMTTTLNTATKVQAIYGGTWVAWGAGRVPVGFNANDSDFSTSEKTGGIKTHKHTTAGHTLTVNEMPNHSHTIRSGWGDGSAGSDAYRYQFWGKNDLGWKGGNLGTGSAGGGASHSHGDTGSSSNVQPYITVYMWKRTA